MTLPKPLPDSTVNRTFQGKYNSPSLESILCNSKSRELISAGDVVFSLQLTKWFALLLGFCRETAPVRGEVCTQNNNIFFLYIYIVTLCILWASLLAQSVRNLPAVQETRVWSLSREGSPRMRNGNPLLYSCLGNPMDRGTLVGYSPWGSQELDMTQQLNHHYRTIF